MHEVLPFSSHDLRTVELAQEGSTCSVLQRMRQYLLLALHSVCRVVHTRCLCHLSDSEMADISGSRVSDCVINGTVPWDFATVQPHGMKTELVEVECRVYTVWRQSFFNVSACMHRITPWFPELRKLCPCGLPHQGCDEHNSEVDSVRDR
jgi:hypothetical protein